MNKKRKAVKLLRESEDIISKHADVFSPFEAMRLAMILRYLLAYVEGGEDVLTSEQFIDGKGKE